MVAIKTYFANSCALCGTWYINSFINFENGFVTLFARAAISAVVPLAFNFIVFKDSDSMLYLKKLLASKFGKVMNRDVV